MCVLRSYLLLARMSTDRKSEQAPIGETVSLVCAPVSVQTKKSRKAALVLQKRASLCRKNASFKKRLKYDQPLSFRALCSPEEQAYMELPLQDVVGEVERKVFTYAAVSNFLKYEKNMSGHPTSAAHYEEMVQEMLASKEGYFYYKNMSAGVSKYAYVNNMKDNNETTRYILDNFGKDGMLKWIKHGFK